MLLTHIGKIALCGALLSFLAFGHEPQWRDKVQILAHTFQEVLPIAVSDSRLSQKEIAQLEKNTKILASLAHDLKTPATRKTLNDEDPSLLFVSSLFEKQLNEAALSLHEGHIDYARRLLRTTTGFCIACHTRNNLGPSFPKAKLTSALEKLSPLEKADWFTATRQFDSALSQYQAISLDQKILDERTIAWEKAVQSELALLVRVKQDPTKAEMALHQIVKLKDIPPSYRTEIMKWKDALRKWKEEKPIPLDTEESLFKEAERLFSLGRANQSYPLDHSAEVWYLRASSTAHRLLTLYPKGKYTSQALLLQGTLYDLLQERVLSSLPELYYEACIRQAPHTVIAAQCYQQYEEDIYFGYSGSGGVNLPAKMKGRMKELSLLASP